jgi:glycosyltransferase involved in cell wall biosynthesis
MRILQLVSCRGWSSDAYLAARASAELAHRGHEVWLGCRRGTEAAVIGRARLEGVERIEPFEFRGGAAPAHDAADVRRLLAWLPRVDVVHVHRGKEHWLAAVANRVSRTPRPLVRTRHIVQAVRPHAANRWLYRRATALVHTVSEAIRRQYIAAGLVPAERAVAIPGGVDVHRYEVEPDGRARASLGAAPGTALVGLVAGLRVMKGHDVVIDAVAGLGAAAKRLRVVFVGAGRGAASIRAAIERGGQGERIALAGFAADLPAVLAALDVALYVPVESEGMSRAMFEALAAARPLIAARVGVVPEVLRDREHAVLVPGGDAPALGAALRELLADGDLRRRLGSAGHALVRERYSGACVARSLEGHYRRLAGAA